MKRGDITLATGAAVSLIIAGIGMFGGWISYVQNKAEGAQTAIRDVQQEVSLMKKDIEATRTGIDVLLDLESQRSAEAKLEVTKYRVKFPRIASSTQTSINK